MIVTSDAGDRRGDRPLISALVELLCEDERLKQPDREIFAELYRGELEFVSRLLTRFGVPSRDLPDVVHDVFVTTYRVLHRYDSNRPFRPWLFGIAYRVASDYRHLSRNTEVLGPSADAGTTIGTSDHLIDAFDRWRISERSLSRLGTGHRTVLLMHDFWGYEVREIALALNIVEKTVYSRLSVARKRFKSIAAAHVKRGSRSGA